MADANQNMQPAATGDRADANAASPADARGEAAPVSPPGIDPRPEAGPGASDGYSGGGPGGGLMDAESGMRIGGDVTNKGDPDRDRQRLFPDARNRQDAADNPDSKQTRE